MRGLLSEFVFEWRSLSRQMAPGIAVEQAICLDVGTGRLQMKALICSLLLAAVLSDVAVAADSPSLVGTWTGQRDRIAKVEGRRGGLATLVITEQQGNTFAGHLKRSNATGEEDEPLWGAFTPGGRLMMGSDDEGFYIFSLRTVCATLTRQR
jgi:hypothetical protein